MKKNKALLTDGAVDKLLIRLSLPMAVGIFSVFLFSLVDMYYVSQLGSEATAAMGFILPFTLFLTNINLGIGTGATSVISNLIGQEGGESCLKKTVASAYFFSIIFWFFYAFFALIFFKKLFVLWGASPQTLSLIHRYLVPWLLGSVLLTLLMITSAILRATGDTKTPSMIMLCSGLLNAVLTPLMTFGKLGFPRMEIQGAVYATLLSWLLAAFLALWLLKKKEGILSAKAFKSFKCLMEVGPILKVGIPAALSNCLVPLSSTILVWLLAKEGEVFVGAFGIANRIEPLAMVPVITLTASLVPFIGQNLGAKKTARIEEAMSLSYRFLIFFELLIALGLFLLASPLSVFFTPDPLIAEALVLYLCLVPFGFAFQALAMVTTSFFNATQRPFFATSIIFLRLFVLQVPMAMVGREIWGAWGIFVGRSLSGVISGIVAVILYQSIQKKLLYLFNSKEADSQSF